MSQMPVPERFITWSGTWTRQAAVYKKLADMCVRGNDAPQAPQSEINRESHDVTIVSLLVANSFIVLKFSITYTTYGDPPL